MDQAVPVIASVPNWRRAQMQRARKHQAKKVVEALIQGRPLHEIAIDTEPDEASAQNAEEGDESDTAQ